MVGKAPNFGPFFVIFSDATKTQQKRKKKCVRNQTNCGDCLLIDGSEVAGFAIDSLKERQRLMGTYKFLYLPDENVSRKCILCHC